MLAAQSAAGDAADLPTANLAAAADAVEGSRAAKPNVLLPLDDEKKPAITGPAGQSELDTNYSGHRDIIAKGKLSTRTIDFR